MTVNHRHLCAWARLTGHFLYGITSIWLNTVNSAPSIFILLVVLLPCLLQTLEALCRQRRGRGGKNKSMDSAESDYWLGT